MPFQTAVPVRKCQIDIIIGIAVFQNIFPLLLEILDLRAETLQFFRCILKSLDFDS